MGNVAAEAEPIPNLPTVLRPLFWDCKFETLDWNQHRSFVIGRVLTDGTWDNAQWLRQTVGDDALREWIVSRKGGPLSPQQLRFWELILHIPRELVNDWLDQEPRKLWVGYDGPAQ